MARLILLAAIVAMAVPQPVLAKGKAKSSISAKAKGGKAKTAAKTPEVPVVVAQPVVPGGFMVPNEVVLRKTTAAETEANRVWGVRAALNIAALQCQYDPTLETVSNYNAVLKLHGAEFTRAQMMMVSHFKRFDGPKRAANGFDQYTTRTYNSYSTLDAQYSFCQQAARTGRVVLATPQNGLGAIAPELYKELRGSLMPAAAAAATATAPVVAPPAMPTTPSTPVTGGGVPIIAAPALPTPMPVTPAIATPVTAAPATPQAPPPTAPRP